ncbi:putative protein YbaA [Methylophilaceae bacterium]|nr:putative protein YbaA [Methylophilaceae bacterium]
MAKYVDGFLIPVPGDKLDEYKLLAEKAGAIWKDHGALDYSECVGDDLDAKDMVSFRTSAGAGPDEVVLFSWIVYESREHRDAVNAAVMADPRMADMMSQDSHPFDCKRMAYGGFRKLVEL